MSFPLILNTVATVGLLTTVFAHIMGLIDRKTDGALMALCGTAQLPFDFEAHIPINTGMSAMAIALGIWNWWNGGGGDDTKRKLRKFKNAFEGVRRTAPAAA
jgi:hypothetical protein